MSNLPESIQEVLATKGLAFQVSGLSELLWHDFIEEFGTEFIASPYLDRYFAAFVDQQIKQGKIDNAIKALRAQTPTAPNTHRKQSLLSEFEDKYRDYLFDDDFLATEEQLAEEEMIQLPKESFNSLIELLRETQDALITLDPKKCEQALVSLRLVLGEDSQSED